MIAMPSVFVETHWRFLYRRQQRCIKAVKTLCYRQERHVPAITLNMLKTNAAACRLHSVLDGAL